MAFTLGCIGAHLNPGTGGLERLPCEWSGRGPFEVGCTVGGEAVRADVDASDPDYAIVWVTVDDDGSPAVLESPEPNPEHVTCGATATGSSGE